MTISHQIRSKMIVVGLLFLIGLIWETTAHATLTAGPDICTITSATFADLKKAVDGYNLFTLDDRICKGRIIFVDNGGKLKMDTAVAITGVPVIKTFEGPVVGTRIESGEGKRFTLDATGLKDCPILVNDKSFIDIIRLDLIVDDPTKAICAADKSALYTLEGDKAKQTVSQQESVWIDSSVTIKGSGLPVGCKSDGDCKDGKVCKEGSCVSPPPPPPPPPPPAIPPPTCKLTNELFFDKGGLPKFKLTWDLTNTEGSGMICTDSGACEGIKPLLDHDSMVVSPSSVTTYTIWARGVDPEKTFCSDKTTVYPPPVCQKFDIKRQDDGTYKLVWKNINANKGVKIQVKDEVLYTSPTWAGNSGSYKVTPKGETTYLLTAFGNGRQCANKTTFTPLPITCDLRQERGTRVYFLSWSVDGDEVESATMTEIPKSGAVTTTKLSVLSGMENKQPTTDATFVLKATSRYGASCESKPVVIQPDTDWDEIPDSKDKCPTLFGSPADGCPNPTCKILQTRVGDHYVVEWEVEGEFLKKVTLEKVEGETTVKSEEMFPAKKGSISPVKPLVRTSYTIKGETEGAKRCESSMPQMIPIPLTEIDTDKDGIADQYDDCPLTNTITPAPKFVTARGCADDDRDNVPNSCEGAKAGTCVTDKCPTVFGPAPEGCPLPSPKCLLDAKKSGVGFDLTWMTENVSSIEIKEGDKTIFSSSTELKSTKPFSIKTPSSPTFYSLIGLEGGKEVCRDRLLLSSDTPVPVPLDCTFNAALGTTVGTYDLSWSVTGGTIKGVTFTERRKTGSTTPKTVAAVDKVTVTPFEETAYILEAENTSGRSCRSELTRGPVLPTTGKGPSCKSITTIATSDGLFDLSWVVEGIDSTKVTDTVTLTATDGRTPEKVTPSGKKTEKPSARTTYTITAKNPFDLCTMGATASPTKTPPLSPSCLSLSADPPDSDGAVFLQWEVKNAKKVTLTEGSLPPEEVTSSRGITKKPVTVTRYKITATGDGEPCSLEISVTPPPPPSAPPPSTTPPGVSPPPPSTPPATPPTTPPAVPPGSPVPTPSGSPGEGPKEGILKGGEGEFGCSLSSAAVGNRNDGGAISFVLMGLSLALLYFFRNLFGRRPIYPIRPS